MNTPPLMGCGHAANSTLERNGQKIPACVICAGIVEGYDRIVESPSLDGRFAICFHGRPHGKHRKMPNGGPIYGKGPNGESPLDGPVVSDQDLPFFEYRPDEEYDMFFCGCWGWD